MDVDLIGMSSNYANFAGILAGFAFSGIYLLIEYEKRDASEVIGILLVGFFGLLLSAFLFSHITRLVMEEGNLEQMKEIAFSIVIASIVFSLAIMQMFLSLVFIFILYRLPKQVINLGKIIYYEVSVIVTLFIITTIPELYLDETIAKDLSVDLFLTALASATAIFALSKIFMRRLDLIFENHFIRIVAGTTVLMLAFTVVYRSDVYLDGIPFVYAHLVVVVFIVQVMINSFSINHEHRMMKLKVSEEAGGQK